jgi:hypothetical protein
LIHRAIGRSQCRHLCTIAFDQGLHLLYKLIWTILAMKRISPSLMISPDP